MRPNTIQLRTINMLPCQTMVIIRTILCSYTPMAADQYPFLHLLVIKSFDQLWIIIVGRELSDHVANLLENDDNVGTAETVVWPT